MFPKFMKWAISKGVLSDYISQTSIAHLTKEKLESLPISIPSEMEQAQISKAFDSLDQAISIEENRLAKLRSLKNALMQDLLTGEVRVTGLLNESEDETSDDRQGLDNREEEVFS